MIATIKVAKFTGKVKCIGYNGKWFTVEFIDTGNFPLHWHGLIHCHPNHIHI